MKTIQTIMIFICIVVAIKFIYNSYEDIKTIGRRYFETKIFEKNFKANAKIDTSQIEILHSPKGNFMFYSIPYQYRVEGKLQYGTGKFKTMPQTDSVQIWVDATDPRVSTNDLSLEQYQVYSTKTEIGTHIFSAIICLGGAYALYLIRKLSSK